MLSYATCTICSQYKLIARHAKELCRQAWQAAQYLRLLNLIMHKKEIKE